jgi:AraC-like DNA-binding protein
VERAKNLLATTDDKIIDIARKTGLETTHKLCRTFRQDCHVSPGAYRKETHNSNPTLSTLDLKVLDRTVTEPLES